MDSIGQRIKKLREGHNLSLDELGRICGVSAQAVHQWESGVTGNIKLEPFLKLCAYFAIDPYVLVFPDEKMRPLPPANSGRYRKPRAP